MSVDPESLPGGSILDNLVELPINAASDDDLARTFTVRHGATWRYIAAWDRWLHWDGIVWRHDEKLMVFDLSRLVCRDALNHSLRNQKLTDSAERGLRHRFGSAATVWAVVKLAGTDPRHATTVDQLDADPWLLNTPGGMVDLRTGAITPNNPTSLCTKVTAAAPGGDCPLFKATLARALPDPEVQRYMQRLAGYGLTGSSRDHVLAFMYGTGRNGKGTLMHAIRYAFGDYATEVPAELLIESHNERHPTELADLVGRRLVIGSEIDCNRGWNEARLKRLTGGDPIKARLMKRDFFEFDPSHTLVILANSKPGLRKVDEAIRARLHLIPFTVTIPETERDLALPEKLKGEAGGILAWAIEGCREWFTGGLQPPPAIREASDSYLQSEDSIANWIAERCEMRGRTKLTAAHQNYREWCESAGVMALGRNQFGDALGAHGVPNHEDRKKSRIFALSIARSHNVPAPCT